MHIILLKDVFLSTWIKLGFTRGNYVQTNVPDIRSTSWSLLFMYQRKKPILAFNQYGGYSDRLGGGR